MPYLRLGVLAYGVGALLIGAFWVEGFARLVLRVWDWARGDR